MSNTIMQTAHEPPANELPVALATSELTWRGDGAGLAVPSLYLYTTGAELLIMFRTQAPQPRGIERIGAISDVLPRKLRVNDRPVELLGGQHQEHGFTYRAWVPLGQADHGNDLVFTLDWPGVTAAERRIGAQQIAESVVRVVTVWAES
jgi:hypothetical protein